MEGVQEREEASLITREYRSGIMDPSRETAKLEIRQIKSHPNMNKGGGAKVENKPVKETKIEGVVGDWIIIIKIPYHWDRQGARYPGCALRCLNQRHPSPLPTGLGTAKTVASLVAVFPGNYAIVIGVSQSQISCGQGYSPRSERSSPHPTQDFTLHWALSFPTMRPHLPP